MLDSSQFLIKDGNIFHIYDNNILGASIDIS